MMKVLDIYEKGLNDELKKLTFENALIKINLLSRLYLHIFTVKKINSKFSKKRN